MKKAAILVLLVSLTLFISGCVEGTSLADLMGTGTEEKEEPDDVLSIKNPVIDPSPVNAGDVFEFSFQLTNLFQRESADDVEVKLYDTGKCENNTALKQLDSGNIFEGATRVMEWKLEAPSNTELGEMRGRCPLKYYVEYSFDAHSRSDLYVVGDDVSSDSDVAQVSPSTRKARGPLKVDIKFSGTQPFKNGSTIPFQVRLRNAGAGTLEKITPKDISINVSYDQDKEVELGGEVYEGNWSKPKTGCVHSLKEDGNNLPFIDGKTPPISCRLYPEGEGTGGKGYPFTKPLSSFEVEVDIEDYTYTLYGEQSVTVEPTL